MARNIEYSSATTYRVLERDNLKLLDEQTFAAEEKYFMAKLDQEICKAEEQEQKRAAHDASKTQSSQESL